jgi:hypothetical protein
VSESSPNDEDDRREDMPKHRQAATVAGLQFVLGIGLVIAVTLPAVFIYYVILPMGWSGLLPLAILLLALVLLGRITWVMMRRD